MRTLYASDRSRIAPALAGAILCIGMGGCGRFQVKPADHFVFVTAKQANLRDRVAAVSNRTGQVVNGEKLKVLERARHSIKVQDSKGETGWIEEKMVATEETAAAFDQLTAAHQAEPEVASAVVRDQVYMHVKPGRDTDRFFLLNEGDKLKLLKRATLEKATTGVAVARAQRAIPQAAGSNAAKKPAAGAPPAAPAKVEPGITAPPPVMEDWWLVRDSAGHAGWVYSRMLDVDAPDSLTRYAEGQRIVGAYVLSTVHDEEAAGDVKDIPVYVTVMSPYKAGLTYDFDQVRVFTWSLQHHRYETGFRQRNIEGYLPVRLSKMKDATEKGPLGQEDLPAFSYKVLAADAGPVLPDAETGELHPGKTLTRTYRLEGNLLRRVGPAVSPGTEEEAHPMAEEKRDKKARKKR